MGSLGYGGLRKLVNANKVANAEVTKEEVATGSNAVKTLSGARILFGAFFLFDGILKWQLLASNQMQGVIQMLNTYDLGFVNNSWLAFGILFGVGETMAGLGLLFGLFQKPSAIVAAVCCFAIWGFSGYGGWGMPGYTDPGGDLMLGLVFVVLLFAPSAYGLASRFHLRERLDGPSIGRRVLRFLIT